MLCVCDNSDLYTGYSLLISINIPLTFISPPYYLALIGDRNVCDSEDTLAVEQTEHLPNAQPSVVFW
jgi:hypothetical protein